MVIQRLLARKTVFRAEWSLGLYSGPSPFALTEYPGNPILTTRQTGTPPARFIADPFLFAWNNQIYLFFELLNLRSRKGEIAGAVSRDGVHWEVLGIVLAQDHHLSFPLVFADQAAIYMLPESHQTGQIILYRAKAFPFDWEPVAILLEGAPYSDAVLLITRSAGGFLPRPTIPGCSCSAAPICWAVPGRSILKVQYIQGFTGDRRGRC